MGAPVFCRNMAMPIRRCDEIFCGPSAPGPPVLGVGRSLFPMGYQMLWHENFFLYCEKNRLLFPESLDFLPKCVYDYDCNHL